MESPTIEKFTPTPEWMAQVYNDLNKTLFSGLLGGCDFGIFTTGKGSQGKTLGFFTLSAKGLVYNKSTDRRLFIKTSFRKIPIDRNNFDNFCKPVIKLNGNYKATSEAWIGVMAHEMCHYYTYMNGFIPKQAHGPEFYSIGRMISHASKGRFTIQRLASAETMAAMELDSGMQAKREQRKAVKISSTNVVLGIMLDGTANLSLVKENNHSLVNTLVKSWVRHGVKQIYTSNNSDLVTLLYGKGFKRVFRTPKWYPLSFGERSWFLTLPDTYKMERVYGNVSEECLSKMIGEAIKNALEDNPFPSGMNLGIISVDEVV